MNIKKYRWFTSYEREKLLNIVKNSPVIEPVFGSTDRGWQITNYKFLIDINLLANKLGRESKTIKNELIRGAVTDISKSIDRETNLMIYSIGKSEKYRKEINRYKQQLQIKIYKHKDLRNFIFENKSKQSLKSIAGRSKLENLSSSISHQTLYNYVDNPRVFEIDRTCLTRINKHKYRLKSKGKRINGVSIQERPNYINSREEFGHWELDLIEGRRGTKCHLMTLCERKTRVLIAIKIENKKSKTIVNAIRHLQEKYILEFGHNIKSITTDNGSEFWGWQEFKKSIYKTCKAISVYFCHPYSSWEKGSIENSNRLIRRKFPKNIDFTNITQEKINQVIDWINNLWRPELHYKSAIELYNECYQTKFLGSLVLT